MYTTNDVSTKPLPSYMLIARCLERQILGMAPNSLLQTEQQLAHRFGANRGTIRRALAFLHRKGLITRERGRGTIVNPPKVTRHLLRVFAIELDMQQQGVNFETRVVDWNPNVIPPDEIRQRLCLPAQTPCALLSLTRLVDERLICFDQRYIPTTLANRLDPHAAAHHAVPMLLQDLAGSSIRSVDVETEITAAPHDVAVRLGVTPGVLVLTNTFTHCLENGQQAEAGVAWYRIDRVKLSFAALASSEGLLRTDFNGYQQSASTQDQTEP